MNSAKVWKAKSRWQSCRGMWTTNMAVLHLPVFTVLLVCCLQTGMTESDVTPRLTFSYSKYQSRSGTCHCREDQNRSEMQRKRSLIDFFLLQMHRWLRVETLLEFLTWNPKPVAQLFKRHSSCFLFTLFNVYSLQNVKKKIVYSCLLLSWTILHFPVDPLFINALHPNKSVLLSPCSSAVNVEAVLSAGEE